MLHNDRIDSLIVKYLKDTISEEERRELEAWMNASEYNRKLFERLTNNEWLTSALQELYRSDTEKGWAKIAAFRQGDEPVPAPARRLWRKLVVAASVILAIGVGGYWFWHSSQPKQLATSDIAQNSFGNIKAPEKNRATIVLSNGNVIYLDSVANGTLTRQAGVSVIKQAGGELVYAATANGSEMVYNTLFNPRGSKALQVTLSDGTKIWLNSETTLRYPVNFTGNDRKVEITGEAYFEVAKMIHKPFKVFAGNMNVEVLGTHFNINAYADEDFISTTLLEGKVKVSDRLHSVEIAPGQQANYAAGGSGHFNIEQDVDIERVIAWKSGIFQFDGVELPVIMRQIGRWYDMDIMYERKPTHDTFGGAIGRQVPLSDVLQMLEGYGIRFRLQDNRIVVNP